MDKYKSNGNWTRTQERLLQLAINQSTGIIDSKKGDQIFEHMLEQYLIYCPMNSTFLRSKDLKTKLGEEPCL